MESLTFLLSEPTEAQDAPYRLLWLQSDEGYYWNSDEPVETILVQNLSIDNATGRFVWNSDNADPEKYSTIRTQSITGVINPNSLAIPPRINSVTSQLYIDLRDFNMLPQAGVAFTITALTKATQGIVLDTITRTHYTDWNGVISILLPQRCMFEVASAVMGETVVTVHTAARTFINLAEERQLLNAAL